MSVIIGHASINENGKVTGGKAGDQTGKEVCTREWYDKNWKYVLRPISEAVAENSAVFVEGVCSNKHVGYDQNNRNTLYQEASKEGFIPANIVNDCNTDCSEFMSCAAYAAGVPINMNGNAPTTSTMVDIFKATGCYQVLTDSKLLTSPDQLKRGDILVSPGHHTVMVLYNNNNTEKESNLNKTTVITDDLRITKHSNKCTEMIKDFEGCELEAYKCAAGVWTIGYGHTKGVTSGMKINIDQAEIYLENDLKKFDEHVAKYNSNYIWNQNEFDALVSFAFNIGNIDGLTDGGNRTRHKIAEKWTEYCHANGKVLKGLQDRRKKELELFLTPCELNLNIEDNSINKNSNKKSNEDIADEVIKGLWNTGGKRRDLLEAAGYNYVTIQQIVNAKLAADKHIYYEVKRGDTLTRIASKYGLTVRYLAGLNNIKDPNKINIGQKIKIK